MTKEEKQFAKGFNVGYLLNQHDPELFAKLVKSSDNDKDYFHGLKLGGKQYDREKLLSQIKESQQRSKNNEREK